MCIRDRDKAVSAVNGEAGGKLGNLQNTQADGIWQTVTFEIRKTTSDSGAADANDAIRYPCLLYTSLGVAALLFVGAHVLGFVKSDPQTGAPTLRFDNLPEIKLGDFDLSKIENKELFHLIRKY